jgi:hypothetical protein
MGFLSLLKRSGVQGLPERAEWIRVADNWWREYFDIKSVESSGWKFAGEIKTDGKPVSITQVFLKLIDCF